MDIMDIPNDKVIYSYYPFNLYLIEMILANQLVITLPAQLH